MPISKAIATTEMASAIRADFVYIDTAALTAIKSTKTAVKEVNASRTNIGNAAAAMARTKA